MAGTLPLLVLIATLGFDRMASALGRSRAGRWALGGLVAAAVVLGPVRGLSRLEGKAPPEGLATIEPALERMVPREALVIAASDRSPQIFLYFMHRKGWSATEAVAAESFAAMIRDGARYLVSDSRALEKRPEIGVHLRPVGAHGPFRVFRLEDPGGS